jgi:hypothetical protein
MVTLVGSCLRDHAVRLRAAKHLEAGGGRPFAAAQGDMDEGNGDIGGKLPA